MGAFRLPPCQVWNFIPAIVFNMIKLKLLYGQLLTWYCAKSGYCLYYFISIGRPLWHQNNVKCLPLDPCEFMEFLLFPGKGSFLHENMFLNSSYAFVIVYF
jgi:hypothetical protein